MGHIFEIGELEIANVGVMLLTLSEELYWHTLPGKDISEVTQNMWWDDG